MSRVLLFEMAYLAKLLENGCGVARMGCVIGFVVCLAENFRIFIIIIIYLCAEIYIHKIPMAADQKQKQVDGLQWRFTHTHTNTKMLKKKKFVNVIKRS